MKFTVERIAIAITTLIGILLLLLSLISMYNDFVQARPPLYLIVDLCFFMVGIAIIGGSLRLYKKTVMFSVVTESAFEEVVYDRLKPLLEEIAFGTTEFSEVKTRISSLEKKIEHIETELTKPPVVEYPPESIALRKTAFYMRTFLTSILFFGTYLFFLNYTLVYGPYLYTLLYAIWWFFITKEFDLFKRMEAWMVLGIPILLVPAGTLILRAVVGLASVMGLIFATSMLYAYLYYLYAKTLLETETGGKKENFLYMKTKEAIRKLLKS
jgi:tetrahydromethanopterin S-methyltransferase subunit G